MTESVVVHGIDHFYVPLVRAEAAFRLLTEELGLPVAWPYMTYGEFASGGVNFGNVNFEVIASSGAVPRWQAQSPAWVQGIAFHPVPTADLVAELERRRLPHSGPEPFPPGATPATGAMWTNTVFESLSDETTTVFACEYHVPGVYDYGARQAALDDCSGGTLGVMGVRELVVGSRNLSDAIERWQRFCGPIAPRSEGCWEFEHGPALRLREGDTDAVEEIVLRVRSVDVAEAEAERLAEPLEQLSIRFI